MTKPEKLTQTDILRYSVGELVYFEQLVWRLLRHIDSWENGITRKIGAVGVGRLWRIPEAEVERFLSGSANAQ